MKIEECINYLLTQAQIKVNLLFKKNLSECGITPAQYILLYHLWGEDGLSPSQLAALSALDASTITGLLTRMEEKALVERRHSQDDRRGVNVFLMERGAKMQREIDGIIERSNAQALELFEEDEQQLLKNSLKRIAKI